MDVVALDADVIVFISAFWQTTCTAIRSGEEGFLIDSPVLPHELDALPRVLEQSGFPLSGLLTTHADWDHLLARHAFPEASLGGAESTVERARERAETQSELDEFDEEHYILGRPALVLEGMQALPVPGRLELGDTGAELELHPTPGHTGDGTAYFAPRQRLLVCGDYLSPVEIPWISPDGSLDAYLETLERLRSLVERATTVVPGHGHPLRAEQALALLDEDVDYLHTLQRQGQSTPLPEGRGGPSQQRIHERNAGRVS